MRHNPGDAEAAAWHDDLIYALHLRASSPAHDDWRSEIVLDIDHIVEWVCGVDGRVRFRVAPASLVFHDVSDLRIWISAAVPAGGAPILLDEQRLPVAGRPQLMREDNAMTQGDRNDR